MIAPAPSRRSCMPTRGGSGSRPRVSSGVACRRSRPRERSGTATTSNSRPLALWMVMIRTPSWPSTAVAASRLGVRLGAGGEEVEQAAQVAALARSRTRRRGASACARWRNAPRPAVASAPPGHSRSPSPRPRSGPPARARWRGSAGPRASRRSGAAAPARGRGSGQALGLGQLGLALPSDPLHRGPDVAPLPAAARSSQRVSGASPQAGEASAPNSAWSSSGLAIVASSAQTSATCCWDQ